MYFPAPPDFLLPFVFSAYHSQGCFGLFSKQAAPSGSFQCLFCVMISFTQRVPCKSTHILDSLALSQEISSSITKPPPCSGAKILSLYLRLHAPPHKWLHLILKSVPGTWPSIGQCLSALCFSIASVLLLPSPASLLLFSMVLSMLWAGSSFLCLFISPVNPGQVLSLDSLYKPSDSMTGPSLHTSVEVQELSHVSSLLSCHLKLSQQSQDTFF